MGEVNNKAILSKVDTKNLTNLRVISFNVNGIKTLFNYHPWTDYNQNLNNVFKDLQGDIISLQELKITNGNISSYNLSELTNYRSFVTLPKVKKGYSGVGLFVRIPNDDESDEMKYNLNVIKAEEGLTGLLKINGKKFKDLDDDETIGGYPEIDEQLGLKIDSEGRSIIIELSNNLVVFSLYCPANSSHTEEGHEFKMKFMEILMQRCEKLTKLNKEIMIIGDINISLDLIDQADGINERLKQKLIEFSDDGVNFELKNLPECFKFKTEHESRFLLNKYVKPSIGDYKEVLKPQQFLYDTTRLIQNRKMGIYTVWNTMNNSRQTNYGSRIDLILTSKKWSENVINANIWPFILGSDHCPVFTDFNLIDKGDFKRKKLAFETKNFYKLVKHHDISTMFKSMKRKPDDKEEVGNKVKLVYKSRKKNDQPSIGNFFFASHSDLESEGSQQSCQNEVESQESIESLNTNSSQKVPPEKTGFNIQSAFGTPPNCDHGLPCQLKTSLNNSKTRGKKFWCCSKTEMGLNDRGRCNYFKWYSK